MNIPFSPTDWIWAAPMALLYLTAVASLADGLLLSPGRRPAGSEDQRILLLGEVQRCCVVTGFLGTLLGVYQVLQSLSGSDLEQMFSGMGSAVTSSIAGCLLFLGAFFSEQLVRLRWVGHSTQKETA